MGEKIIFQKCNFNNIYFLLYIIMFLINLFIESYNFTEDSEIDVSDKDTILLSIQLLRLYLSNLSDFVAVIPYFIRKKLLRKKEENIKSQITNSKENEKENSESSSLIYIDNKIIETDKRRKKIIYYSLLVAIFDFLFRFSLILYNIIYPNKLSATFTFCCVVPFEIFFQFICSYFILKVHFYKLQYFSLFLNLFIFIILLTIDIIDGKDHDLIDLKFYIFIHLSIIFYSIKYSYGKKAFLYGYVSIYLLLLMKGIFKFMLVILLTLILLIAKRDVFIGFKYYIIGPKYALLIIANIITRFFVNLFLWLIIDRFSPNYLPLALIFEQVCYFIIEQIYQDEKIVWETYLRIALYIISLIGVMIHNEIVVINICNLGSDTKYFLDKKVQSEELYSSSDNPDILQKYETFEMDIKSEDSNSINTG